MYSSFSCHKCTRWSHPILTFLTWNWRCYQRAYSSIYQIYFWKVALFADAILLHIWLYTHMSSLLLIVWKTNEILHIVQSDALGVCFSIEATKPMIYTYTVHMVQDIHTLYIKPLYRYIGRNLNNWLTKHFILV